MDPAWELGESVISLTPHSGSTLEIFRSGGIALAVIGGLLLIARPLRWVLLPLSLPGIAGVLADGPSKRSAEQAAAERLLASLHKEGAGGGRTSR